MSKMTFALAVLIGATVLVEPTGTSANEIALFDYHGDKAQFDALKGMLDRRLVNLPVVVFGSSPGSPNDRAHLASLKIVARGPDTLGNTAEVLVWISHQGNVLSVLQGTILLDSGVFSKFTLAEPIPNYPSPVISVAGKMTSDYFANNQDEHTLLMLYALARDAKRHGLSSSYISALLDQATKLLSDISRRSNGNLGSDLKALEADLASGLKGVGP